MSIVSKIKSWVKRTFGGGSSSRSSSRSRASRVSNYGGGGSRSYSDYSSGGYRSDYEDRQEAERRRRQEQLKKRQATTNALASISKRTDALSSGRSSSVASSAASTGNGYKVALKKIEQKATPPDAKLKQDAKEASKDRATKLLKQIKSVDAVKNEKALIKSGDYERMPAAKNMNTPSASNRAAIRVTPKGFEKQMQDPAFRTAISASRGGLGGVSWGVSGRLLAGDKNDAYDRAMEEVYQKNKNHWAELGGELVGSAVSFGKGAGAMKTLVGGAARKGVNRLAGEGAFELGVKNLTSWLAKNPAVRHQAEKELKLAAKKGLVEISDDVSRNKYIQEFAAKRATKLVDALGAETALNLTGVQLMDINRASTMYETGSEEWWNELKQSAKLNTALSGFMVLTPALRVRGGMPFFGGVRRDTKELINTLATPKAGDAVKAELPKMREAMMEAFARDGDNAGRNFDMNELLTQNLKKATDTFSTPKVGEQAKAELPRMRQAMREAFVREGDDAGRRIDMNDVLAQNSPFRQADEVARAADASTQNIQEEAAQAVKEQFNTAAETAAPRQLAPEESRMLIENDEGVFDQYRARFERDMNDLDLESMEETIRRIKRNAQEAGIDYDTSELEKVVAGYKRVLDDMENGIEWRMGNKGWERLSTRGKSKGKWIKRDPLKTKPPKAKAEPPEAMPVTPEERNKIMAEAEAKADNIRASFMDNEKPLNPKLTAEEKAANVANLNTGEARAADDASNFAGIKEDVDYKGERVDMGFEEGGDDLARAKNAVREEVDKTRASASEFDAERAEAYSKAGLDVKPESKERMTVEEIKEVRSNETRDFTTHTEKGFGTAATGLGDASFRGKAYDAIARGELNIDVYHNKENYEAAAGRLKAHLERNGNMDAWRDKFNDYAKRVLPLNTEQQRELIYDGLAAIDYANSLAKSESEAIRDEAGELFLSACRALSEQASVGGLTGNQFRLIAMSSPEYRAKAMYETILGIFNRSAGMRKALGKGKGNPITMEELTKVINENPALKKTLDALNALDSASSVEEVEKLASKAYLEARKVMPMTFLDQLTQWRYVAMLSSPRTHIRNVTANIYGATLGQFRDAAASSIEDNLFRGKGKAGKQLQEAIKAGNIKEDDLFKSAGGLSWKANADSRKGTRELFRVNSLTTKLERAKDALDNVKSSDTAEMKRLGDRVKSLEAELSKAQKSLEEKVGSIERKEAKKAQEYWQTRGRDALVTDAEKWERRNYNGGFSKGAFKLNDKASNFISKALETSDAISLEGIYREKFDKILSANNWSELAAKAEKGDLAAKARLAKLEEYAAQEAAWTAARDTYRNYSKLSSALNKFISDSLFNYDAPIMKKGAGLLAHAVMPFTKVPVNIVKRGLNYSPAGLIEAKRALQQAIESGNVTEINRACERIAEGRIGTGIMMLGAGLGFADPDGYLITGKLDKHDYLDKKKKDAGYQDYAMNVGNMSFTLDWATPTAATWFTGVEAGRILRQVCDDIADGNGVQFNFWEAFDVPLKLASTLVEPTLQLGVFQGINNALEKTVEADNYSDTNIHPALNLVGEIMTNYGTSMITPALLSSLARSFAPYDYYTPYGSTAAESTFNQQMAKHPLVAKLTGNELGANTNVWGEIKGEKNTFADKAAAFALNNLQPANVKKITWDETDEWAADYYKKTGYEGVFPENYRKDEIVVGRTKDAEHLKLSPKDIGDYNVARGKAGADAMDALLNDTVLFTRYSKDDKGHYTVADPKNYTDSQKEKLIKDAENWTLREVVDWMRNTPEFQNATEKEQQTALSRVYGSSKNPFDDGTDQVYGSTRGAQRSIAMKKGMAADEYDYYNEVPARVQENLKPAIDAGVITMGQALDYARNGGKTYYKTDESGETGGSVMTYYNKAEGIAYLEAKGYSHDEAEALYNAFKKSDAKDYDYAASHSGKGGRRRRGRRRRGWRHYGHGGSSKKATVPTPKAIKASQFTQGTALGSTTKSASTTKSSAKATPPTLKRVQAKIDLPTVKTTTKKR